MTKPVFEPLRSFIEYPPEEMAQRAASYHSEMKRRRTVREYADRPVPRGVIEDCLRAAATAPSGANIQPWYFVVVEDGELKQQIRLAAGRGGAEFLPLAGAEGVAGCRGAARYR